MEEVEGSARTHTVTLIAGDGIGPEVTEAVVRILEAAVEGSGAKFAWEPFLVGANAYEKYGEYIPQAVYDSIDKNHLALKGPVTTPIAGGFSSSTCTCARSLSCSPTSVPSRICPVWIPATRESI